MQKPNIMQMNNDRFDIQTLGIGIEILENDRASYIVPICNIPNTTAIAMILFIFQTYYIHVLSYSSSLQYHKIVVDNFIQDEIMTL